MRRFELWHLHANDFSRHLNALKKVTIHCEERSGR